MTAHGILRRGLRCGLWRRDHDLSGIDWTLILPLPRETALHLLDHGVLCRTGGHHDDALTPGIIVLDNGIEARLCLGRPQTAIGRADGDDHGLRFEETPRSLADLWLSDRTTLTH